MRRITSVLIAVLLGAFATGIGTVPFLVLANQDRYRLASELTETKQRAEQVVVEKQQIAEEANKKVEAANAEILRAESVLSELEIDRQLTTTAPRLTAPPPREIPKWEPIVSLFQETKLSIPPNNVVTNDRTNGLVVETTSAVTSTSSIAQDNRWLMILPFDAEKEQKLTEAMSSTTDVTYLIGNVLLRGKRGYRSDGTEAFVARTRFNATSTHLIWIKAIDALGRSNGFERILGTLEFNEDR